MKIAWFCVPAHGHTNPTLGLVKKLTELGAVAFIEEVGKITY